MIRIVNVEQTCYAKPSAWDAWLPDGRYVALRYRHGVGTATHFESPDSDVSASVELKRFETGDRLDGLMDLPTFCALAGMQLDLQTPYTPMTDPNTGWDGDSLWLEGVAATKAANPPVSVRAEVLREAERLVCGDRDEQYGNPKDNLLLIANYWNDYLYPIMQSGGLLDARDVALMMVLLKVAREATGHKRDNSTDGAGYFAIADEVA